MAPTDYLDRYVDLFIRWPRRCCSGCCVMLLGLTGLSVGLGCMEMTLDQDSAWRVHAGKFTQVQTAFEKAAESVDRLDRTRQEDDNENVDEDEKPIEFSVFYKAGSGDTIFTPEHLRDICRFESLVLSRAGGEGICPQTGGSSGGECPQISAAMLFYGNLTRAVLDDCPELAEVQVSAMVTYLRDQIATSGSESPLAGLLEPAFADTGKSMWTLGVFKVMGKDRVQTEEFLLKEVFEPLNLKYGFLRSAFQGDDDMMVASGSVRVRMFFLADEFMRMLPPDFSLALASVVFVFLTIWAHLGSLFLAAGGMWQIVASLPIAGIFYRKIFMVEYFEFVHILVVYLVLGIGADDIFVLLDTWRHIKAELGLGWGTGGIDEDTFRHALRRCWVRTAGAIFNTSFTTAVAFISMSVSKVMPMRTCGYFAAVCIVLNYIFSITFTPALLMVHQLYFGGKSTCDVARSAFDGNNDGHHAGKAAETYKLDTATGASGRGGGCFSGIVERFLCRFYLPLMRKRVGPIKPLPLFSVLVMLAVAGQGAYFASKLTPPSKPEEWFPKNHMWNGLTEFTVDTFFSADYDNYATVRFVWGIAGMDFTNFNEYKPDDFPGEADFDDSFDLSTREAQEAFLATCRALRNLGCTVEGCRVQGSDKLVMQQGSMQAISCFMEDFQDWLATNQSITALPTGSNFSAQLQEFIKSADPKVYANATYGELLKVRYSKDIGFDGDRLKYAAIHVRIAMPNVEPYGTGIEVRNVAENFVEEQKKDMPKGMQSLAVAGPQFASFDLGLELIQGLFSGCAIAGPIVFLVLLLSTRNIILAFYAVLSVGAIVISVLGFCKRPMGYDLGVGEAIAGVIVIGYSVDYVIHLAHIYCEAATLDLKTRDERSAYAVENMGSTVFAGAITTAGSGACMFFCFLTFFFKMALLICMTIFYSFLFSLFLFMGLCFLAGPEGSCGNICCCLQSRENDQEEGIVRV